MRIERRQFLRLAAAAAAVPGASRMAQAQTYPTRNITLVVPFPAGGGVDTLARVVAEKLSTALKQIVIVDNRAGAGGTIGTRAVAKAEPDGYTLLLGHTGTMAINPSLYTNAGYDPRKDLAPIGLIASMPVALIANPTFPAKTVAEVIALAKKDPGKLNFGTAPVGTGGYLTAEYFKSVTGLDMQIVPYRGTGPLINDLVGGHVPISFGVLPPAMGNIQAGTLRVIAVTRTEALQPSARCADRRRIRPAGFRLRPALRPAGAGAHTARDRQSAQRGAAQDRGVGCGQAAHPAGRRRSLKLHARGICEGHRSGRAQVVGADQEAEPEGGVSSVD